MARELIKRFTPDREMMKNHPMLKRLGSWLHDPSLWHLNRRSASWAMFIGLFWAFVPVPGQMIGAAVTAVIFRKHVPISVALVWLTNPITMPPVFYATYRLGAWLLGVEPQVHHFELTWEWMKNLGEAFGQILPAFLLGSLLSGIMLGALGSTIMNFYWKHHVMKRYHTRQIERRLRAMATPTEK